MPLRPPPLAAATMGLTARARAVLADERARGLLYSAACVASEAAWEMIGFVAVGERHVSERHDLPSWSYDIDGDRILPTTLARDVAVHPATHAAALSPGLRKKMVAGETFYGEGDPMPPFAINGLPLASRRALVTRLRVDAGWEITLTDLGHKVARLLAEGDGTLETALAADDSSRDE